MDLSNEWLGFGSVRPARFHVSHACCISGLPPVRPVLQIRLEGALMLHISGLHLVRPFCVSSRLALLC